MPSCPTCDRQGSGRIIDIGSVLGFLPLPYGALYAATKHAIEGYSESLDHEVRTRGIRVSVIEPASTKTQFDANLLQPDSKLDEYRADRASQGEVLREVMAEGDEPGVVAEVVLKAATAQRPKLRYAAGGLATACAGFAGLRPPAWWTLGFARTCGSVRPSLHAPTLRRWRSREGRVMAEASACTSDEFD